MGLSLSILVSAWKDILKRRCFDLAYYSSFFSKDGAVTLRTQSFKKIASETILGTHGSTKIDSKKAISLNGSKPEKVFLQPNLSFTGLVEEGENYHKKKSKIEQNSAGSLPDPAIMFSPRPASELEVAAVKLQKVYKSYRTRRNLADCAVVVEELWWKTLDSAALKQSSVSFFDVNKPETAISRWARALTRAAKVGKGLSKNEKAKKLALQHWLEAIDPRHRYGHNLHVYYDVWFKSESSQPFFYWLDIGDGKEINLEKCPRATLQRQCIKYLGPKEREAYEVVVENGKLVYRQSGNLVQTEEGSKWIFVLSTSRALYVGQKKKGVFQHSSFLSGGAITAAGRLVAHDGALQAIWPYSGHYHPTEENFREFTSFLVENNVDLSNVKTCAVDDDSPYKLSDEEPKQQPAVSFVESTLSNQAKVSSETVERVAITTVHQEPKKLDDSNKKPPIYDLSKRISCKWTTGAGPRIGCVRDYPAELQWRALEHVNLSPRLGSGPVLNYGPIPSPRPSPKVRLSPRIANMGLPSPRTPINSAS